MVAIPKESRGGKVDRCSNCTKTEQELAELKSLMAGWYKLLHQLDLTPEEVQLLHSKDAQLKQACTLANDSKEVE